MGKKVKITRSVGYGGLCVYLKNEIADSGSRFYPLEMKRSLRHNLSDKVLVEHPVLHLVMKGEQCNYRYQVYFFWRIKLDNKRIIFLASVFDPDPYGSAIYWGLWIRIRF